MILSLEIENYKSIEKIELDFGKLNVLIGKNGAGKTTLISVINMLKGLSSGRNINTIINEIAPYGEIFNAKKNSNIIRVKAKVQTRNNNVYIYSFSIGFGVRRELSLASRRINRYYFIDECLSLVDNSFDGGGEVVVFKRNVNEDGIRVGEGGDNIPQRVGDGVAVLSAYSQPQVREVAETLSAYSIIWMEHGSSVGNRLQFANDLDLSTIDGVAVGLFLKDKDAYEESMKIIGEIIPGFISPIIRHLPLDAEEGSEQNPAQTGYFVSWHDGGYVGKTTMSSGSLSGGNSRVIYLILSLYYSDAKTCFVAEEIENGMHMRRIACLMDKLKMIGKNRKMQLFFTTHNYLILNDLLPQEVILARMSERGAIYTKVSDTSEYEDIKAELGRDPTGKEIADSGLLYE